MNDTRQEQRVNAGLCPQCGKEAAPYYLCGDCRSGASLGRCLKRLKHHEFVTSEKQGRSILWKTTNRDRNISPADVISTKYPLWGEGKGADDARLRPRIKGLPVNVEATLIELMREEARPLSIEEINTAWGKLRVKAGRASAAHDLRALVLAERKRQQRYAKRKASVCGDSPEAQTSS